MRRILTVCALLVLVVMLVALADDWPMYRGTPAQTGIAPAIPAKLKTLWTYEANDAIQATAAIVGGKVYVATQGGHLIALNLVDGKRIWQYKANDPISSSPCVVGNTVMVGDEGGTFYAVNTANGKLLWKYATGAKIMSSATSAPGVVLFGSYDNTLYCLTTAGKLKWKFTADAQVHCSPCIAEGRVIIAGCDGKVRMIDLQTGKQRAVATVEGNFAAAPAYHDGAVYVGSLLGDYLAVRVKDGKVLWKVSQGEEQGACYAGAAVTADSVIFASRAEKVVSLNRKNGKTRWTFRAKSPIDSSPVLAGTTLYVGSDAGVLYGLDVKTGKKTWQFNAGAELKASPALADNRLVLGSGDGAVYCFGK